MSALDETLADRACFISPVVDMESLIGNMMQWANVTEQELAQRGEAPTDFGETLSWRYLRYVRQHSIAWNVPTRILYGEHDNLTSLEPYRRSPGAITQNSPSCPAGSTGSIRRSRCGSWTIGLRRTKHAAALWGLGRIDRIMDKK